MPIVIGMKNNPPPLYTQPYHHQGPITYASSYVIITSEKIWRPSNYLQYAYYENIFFLVCKKYLNHCIVHMKVRVENGLVDLAETSPQML